eukprot:gene10448-19156_t
MAVKRADLVFDAYKSPSIEDIESQARGGSDVRRFFFVPVEDFKDESYGPLFSEKELFCAVDNECTKFSSDCAFVFAKDVEQHEEADKRIAFHAMHSSQLRTDSIVVRANDTDVLVIWLANHASFSGSHIWLEVGISVNNLRRYIDVSKLAKDLGDYVQSLPRLHAFTGRDYISSLCRQGKNKLLIFGQNKRTKV